ncbi:TonB-dependent hemoglobin/transferrin/lactoferrin family receptor [uncultured Ferrimonas sp.]|uniref:TonB-dependent hemoglobin/transferrin/lactoferrin family receptor n=1 Tax=uncultured Ferrimonas sp. TaxID=432640 RepID=UPI00261E4FDA|nr:TonB-dependent hemoglobin/transferrin/lactoferrin family receptor [uncultured Ferrimonas sp.]
MKKTALGCAVAAALFAPIGAQAETVRDDVEVMVISASRVEQNLQQVAGAVSVIDEEEIARNMSTDFATLFRTNAAVDVKGGAGKSSSVTIRGIGGNRVMMVKDGVRVNNQYASPLGPGAEGTGRGLTEVTNLKQVEVVKAAASSIYGSDALGGVVVMTTKDAGDYLYGDDRYLSVNSGFTGMNNEWFTGVTAAAAYGDVESMISVQHRDGEEQSNYDDDMPDSDLLTDSITLKSSYQLSGATELQLSIDYLRQQLDRYESVRNSSAEETDTFIDTDRTTEVWNGSLKVRTNAQHAAFDTSEVVFYYGLTDQNEWRDYIDSDTDLNREYRFEEQRYGVSSVYTKALNNHQLVYGFDVEHSSMSRTRDYVVLQFGQPVAKQPFAFPDTDSLRSGAFIQDEITVSDALNVIAALRYDNFYNDPNAAQAEEAGKDPKNFKSMSDDFWSPKLGLIYGVSDDVSVYAQYAHGYKMPTPDQKWGELEVKVGKMPFPVQVKPNYDLESESSDTIELGVRGQHRDTNYEMTLFYTEADDFIEWEPTGFLTYQYTNIDKVKLRGVELQLSQWLGQDTQLSGNVAYTHGKDGDGNYLNSISPLQGVVSLQQFAEFGAMPAEFNLAVRFADDQDKVTKQKLVEGPFMGHLNEVYTTAGYAVVDLTVGLELSESLKLRAGVHNLLDKQYTNYTDVAGLSKGLTEMLGGRDSDYTQPGRYGSVNLNYVF